MRVLLHTCCGPCLIYPESVLRAEGMKVTAYFHNPNIHPFREFKERMAACSAYLDSLGLPSIIDKEYGLVPFLRSVVFREDQRCSICYAMRLEKTAELAGSQGFDGFSTTLLYSKYQNHQLLRMTAATLAEKYGIPFVYRDFREGWQQGIDASKALGMYRQAYCGCIFSEQERYDKSLKKHRKKKD